LFTSQRSAQVPRSHQEPIAIRFIVLSQSFARQPVYAESTVGNHDHRRAAAGAAFLILAAALYSSALGAQAPQATTSPAPSRCRVDGRVSSGGAPLPGASVIVRAGAAVRAATSTDVDGRFAVLFAPESTYHLTIELTAFTSVDRDITLGPAPCDTTLELTMALRPRGESAASASAAAVSQAQSGSGLAARGARGAGAGATDAAPDAPAAGARGRGRGQAPSGRGAQRGANRFQTLDVQAGQAEPAQDEPPADDPAEVERLLPAGFTLDAVDASAVAIANNGDATSLDRGALNDRLQAIAGGQFDPATGQFAPGFGPAALGGFGAGDAAPGQAPGGGPGGRGPGGRGAGPGGPGGRGGGPGGRGGFVLAGRGARGQSPYQGSVNYTFGGSILNAAPYQLNPAVPVTEPQYAQNTAGVTFGGPFKIPGIYKNENRRTNFQLNYQGNRSNNVFDQYATVPTDDMRAGDFSASAVQLVDPKTGQPFAGNKIPAGAMDPASLALLGYIPRANLPGDQLNYHVSTTARTASDSVSLRFTQNLSPTVQQGGRGGRGGAGGFGGRGGGFGGLGGGGRGGAPGAAGRGRPTNVVLSGQLQVRHTNTENVNIFPGLGGTSTATSIAAPITLNIVKGRTVNNITVNVTHATNDSTNAFSGVQNVAGDAGIQYPNTASLDPLNWGVPSLVFSGFSGLRGAGASARADNRITTSYAWSHPVKRHQLRIGADYRFDTTTTESNANPRGTFTFTGVYSTGGSEVSRGTGADFADFLLGAPQQAALQVGGTTHLRAKSFDAYIEDNWQKSARLTFNLGLRYELALPYVEANGQMVNLDAAPGFIAVAPVQPGASGPYSGTFPAGLLYADRNNLGPRVGFAFRMTPRTILRGGYSITYNPSSYATIARQLVAQPPFAETETVTGTETEPLDFEDALLSSTSATTNNYGVDKNYALGQIQTWNATVTRSLTPVWSVLLGYTGIRGTDLDLLSAPNRGPSGLLLPDVQPFIWESSGAHSILNQGNVQLMRRLAHGVSGSASYTLSKSMDDSPSLGGGPTIVAQDPGNLAAEYSLSNFDRRHQFAGNLFVELPFGDNRRWLHSGGMFGKVFGDWSASFTFTAQSGTPLTARVVGAAGTVSQGASGALRANYIGGPISLADPSVSEFFNTAAFGVPSAGTFGDSTRNMIVGPGSHQLNAQFVRDIRLGGNRALTLNVNAVNLLNTVIWGSVDTNINSPTFGQVLTVRPRRVVTVNARFRF
jgi:hypothetical protein